MWRFPRRALCATGQLAVKGLVYFCSGLTLTQVQMLVGGRDFDQSRDFLPLPFSLQNTRRDESRELRDGSNFRGKANKWAFGKHPAAFESAPKAK